MKLMQVRQCEACDAPAEAMRYEYCYNCWWSRDPRNPKNLLKQEIVNSVGYLVNQGAPFSEVAEEIAKVITERYTLKGK